MILADTSVWIDHLCSSGHRLGDLLRAGRIVTHPFIIGEIALGSLAQRSLIIELLRDLPQLPTATEEELLDFIERHSLFGQGIGHVDAHVLASTMIVPGTSLWTRDRRLHNAAVSLGVA